MMRLWSRKCALVLCSVLLLSLLLLYRGREEEYGLGVPRDLTYSGSSGSRLASNDGPTMLYRYKGGYECVQEFCAEYLSERDSNDFQNCEGELVGSCHFMRRLNRRAVALVSFPGSGNTWVRGLLEKATGICTGAYYCDRTLRKGGFNGEHIVSAAVLVVKTHNDHYNWMKKIKRFNSAILLVRNPREAFVSDWNRKFGVEKNGNHSNSNRGVGGGGGGGAGIQLQTKHTRLASPDMFGSNEDWDQYLRKATLRWESFIASWYLTAPDENRVLLVRYEDLRKNTAAELKRMLNFLDQPYNDTELQEILRKDFADFRRSKPAQEFEYYTPAQKKLINKSVYRTVRLLFRKKRGSLKIDQYLELPFET